MVEGLNSHETRRPLDDTKGGCFLFNMEAPFCTRYTSEVDSSPLVLEAVDSQPNKYNAPRQCFVRGSSVRFCLAGVSCIT